MQPGEVQILDPRGDVVLSLNPEAAVLSDQIIWLALDGMRIWLLQISN